MLAIFLVALSSLLFELTLTRLLSVTLWYHYASFAVSIALFGIAAAGVSGTLSAAKDEVSPEDRSGLALSALWMAVGMVASTLVFLNIDLRPQVTSGWGPRFLLALGLFAIPFYYTGAIILRLLRGAGGSIGLLYASDLAGAALACIAFVPLLDRISGPGLVLLSAALAALAAVILAGPSAKRRAAGAISLVVLAGSMVLVERGQLPGFRIRHGKLADEKDVRHEKWSALCRIAVFGDEEYDFRRGWGMSPAYTAPLVPSLFIEQDGSAGTPLPRFRGDLAELEELRHDVTAAAHRIRSPNSVAIIGAGGGRDILTALTCGAKAVTAVELNPDIVEAVQQRFADFTGKPYSMPGVQQVVAEGRSFIARSKDRYDLLQISMIDSWAASAAGGYVFSESALYTSEAFEAYLDHLTPDGVLSISRWWTQDFSLEVVRLVTLARELMERRGVRSLADHLVIFRCEGVATFVLKLTPFTAEERTRMEELARTEKFEMVTSGGKGSDPLIAGLIGGDDWRERMRQHPLEIGPSTDDRPFFFHPMKLSTFFTVPWQKDADQFNMQAIWMLAGLVPTTAAIAAILLMAPLIMGRRRQGPRSMSPRAIAYFCCLGAGYMLVEMALMGRLVIFLEHPTYAVSVVLALMLLASAAGSACAGWIGTRRRVIALFGALSLALLCMIFSMEAVLEKGADWPLAWRIGAVALIVGPAAFCMGVPFPLGLSRVKDARGVAWAWAANGAVSVFAGLAATWIAVLGGFQTVLWVALACYLVAGSLQAMGGDVEGR